MQKQGKKSQALELFSTFFRIGAFTFGGGYAMIELIKQETVMKHHWISEEDILDVVAIAESTPGPIAINSATFIGYKVAGISGSFAATAGVVLPSFVIIYVISFVLKQFEQLLAVRYAFFGIRAAVLALILQALLSMYHACPKGKMEYLVMAAAFLAVALFDCNVLIVIVCAACIGLAYIRLVRKEDQA
ncbi:MAG: chromate transporter [Bulleidia sp.]